MIRTACVILWRLAPGLAVAAYSARDWLLLAAVAVACLAVEAAHRRARRDVSRETVR